MTLANHYTDRSMPVFYPFLLPLVSSLRRLLLQRSAWCPPQPSRQLPRRKSRLGGEEHQLLMDQSHALLWFCRRKTCYYMQDTTCKAQRSDSIRWTGETKTQGSGSVWREMQFANLLLQTSDQYFPFIAVWKGSNQLLLNPN